MYSISNIRMSSSRESQNWTTRRGQFACQFASANSPPPGCHNLLWAAGGRAGWTGEQVSGQSVKHVGVGGRKVAMVEGFHFHTTLHCHHTGFQVEEARDRGIQGGGSEAVTGGSHFHISYHCHDRLWALASCCWCHHHTRHKAAAPAM